MRDGIAFAVKSQKDMEMVGEAPNGTQAVAAYRLLKPDVTLMDLQLPGMDGIEAIEVIRKEFPRARSVVLTTYSGDVQAARALKPEQRAICSRACCALSWPTPSGLSMLEAGASPRRSPRNSPNI